MVGDLRLNGPSYQLTLARLLELLQRQPCLQVGPGEWKHKSEEVRERGRVGGGGGGFLTRERRTALYKSNHQDQTPMGAGIAQWLERRTRD